MMKVVEELRDNELRLQGNIVDVCEMLRDNAWRNKGMTVAQFLRLRKVQKAEERQFGHKLGCLYE